MSYQVKSTPFFQRMFSTSKRNGQLQRLREEYERIQEFSDRTIEQKMRQVRLKRLFREIEDMKEQSGSYPQTAAMAIGPKTGEPVVGARHPRSSLERQKSEHALRVEALINSKELGKRYGKHSRLSGLETYPINASPKIRAAAEVKRREKERRDLTEKRIRYGNAKSDRNLERMRRDKPQTHTSSSQMNDPAHGQAVELAKRDMLQQRIAYGNACSNSNMQLRSSKNVACNLSELLLQSMNQKLESKVDDSLSEKLANSTLERIEEDVELYKIDFITEQKALVIETHCMDVKAMNLDNLLAQDQPSIQIHYQQPLKPAQKPVQHRQNEKHQQSVQQKIIELPNEEEPALQEEPVDIDKKDNKCCKVPVHKMVDTDALQEDEKAHAALNECAKQIWNDMSWKLPTTTAVSSRTSRIVKFGIDSFDLNDACSNSIYKSFCSINEVDDDKTPEPSSDNGSSLTPTNRSEHSEPDEYPNDAGNMDEPKYLELPDETEPIINEVELVTPIINTPDKPITETLEHLIATNVSDKSLSGAVLKSALVTELEHVSNLTQKSKTAENSILEVMTEQSQLPEKSMLALKNAQMSISEVIAELAQKSISAVMLAQSNVKDIATTIDIPELGSDPKLEDVEYDNSIDYNHLMESTNQNAKKMNAEQTKPEPIEGHRYHSVREIRKLFEH